MTAQRKRRGRKPATILNWLAGYESSVKCYCMSVYGAAAHSDDMKGCARTHFRALIREARTALKKGRQHEHVGR